MATAKQKLETYRAKRRFDVTPEPAGEAPSARPGWSFVVQKHAARRLHYDFRLELDGVLLSWAVPKGPSLKPGERRLAARTEDHPLEYAGFEGIIPADEYGGGTVVVWDRGSWKPEGDPHDGMTRGRLTFTLAGAKLRGRWHLVRTKGGPGRRGVAASAPAAEKESWLLMKGKDDAASDVDIVETRPESVITGRKIEEVARDQDRVWHSNRRGVAASAKRERSLAGATPAPVASNNNDINSLVTQIPTDIPLTNLDKVLYPEMGLTKGALIAYLAVVAEPLLAQAGGRPLTLVRCPEGRHKQCFFQKHALPGTPASVKRAGELLYIETLAGVVALAQLGVLELHTWGCHTDQIERPDQLVFDLDPDPTVSWDAVAETAIDLRGRLQRLGLDSFVKTTGGKGLHVVAPIVRRTSWDAFKGFAKAVSAQLEAEHPGRYTTNPLKAKRKGKIFVDYLRNARGASAIAAFSPRAREGAPVAVPITWDELAGGIDPMRFTVPTAGQWLTARAAAWKGYDALRQSIRTARPSGRAARRK